LSDLRPAGIHLSSTSAAAISLVVGLLAQSCGIIWWGAHIDQRMTVVEQKVASYSDAAALLARLDERTATLTTLVNRIDTRLNAKDDRLSSRP
jgi:hypothetical protein